jgi:hypothetical protein
VQTASCLNPSVLAHKLRRMLARLRILRRARRREQAAIQRALQEFRARRSTSPMNGYVLYRGQHEIVVRVTFFTHHIPPDRAWFAVSEFDGSVRELSFDDVAPWESPWR